MPSFEMQTPVCKRLFRVGALDFLRSVGQETRMAEMLMSF